MSGGWMLRAAVTLPVLWLAACGGPSEKELLAQARNYLASNDSRAAVVTLKSALQNSPESGEVRYLLGKTLLASGDAAGAVVELRKAQDLRYQPNLVLPDLARAMIATGEQDKVLLQFADAELTDPAAAAELKTTIASVHAARGNKDQALEFINAARQAKPDHAPAITLLAGLKAGEGEFDAALALVDEALAAQPGYERAGLLKADILLQGKKQPEAAIEAYRQVLAASPKAVGAHTAIIGLHYARNDAAAARAQVAEMKKALPDHPETVFHEAQIAFLDKDYKGARELTEKVLRVLPDSPRVLELAGAAEFRLRNYAQVETLLGQALKNAPGLLLSRHLLAQTYLRAGQPNKALEVLQPIVESANADGASLALAGEALLQLGDARRSEAAFARAAKAAPEDARVRTSVALAQYARGDSVAALRELENIANADSGPRADLALISGRLRQGDIAGALKAVDSLQKKVPDQPLAYNVRGRILLLKRDLPAATAAFEQALQKDPQFFPAVASLAAIDLDAGKPEAARQRFQDVLKSDPRNYRALLALAELGSRTGAPAAEVLKPLDEAVKLNPSEPAPRLLLVSFHLGNNDAKAALAAAQNGSAALPNNLELMDALGRAQMAAGEAQQAVSTYRKLAALQTSNPMHQVRLAEAHALAKDNEAAGKSLRAALEIQPGMLAAQRGLISLALEAKRPADALALAREIQKNRPKEAVGFAVEGDIEATRQGWDAAIAAYRAALSREKVGEVAIKLHATLITAGRRADADRQAGEWTAAQPRDAGFQYYLGDRALAERRLPQAEAHYRAVLAVQPKNALAMNNVAWLLATQSRPGAVAMAEQANALLPDRAALLDTLATALAAENQLPRAIETQKKAMARSPDDPSLRLNLARIYLKAGQKDLARAELDTLSKLGDKFGGQAEVKELLQRV